MKSKLKFLITTFALLLMFSNLICFASDNTYGTMLISDTTNYEVPAKTNSDLYITDSEYEINDAINGNVFSTADNLNINSSGSINGNLFAAADNVNLKSDFIYSDTQKNDQGTPNLSINKFSLISGNVFILADNFNLEPGCKINGDLYICAQEVNIKQNSEIGGNLFIYANKFNLNGKITGDLYASVQSFDMQYFGFIERDLYLTTEEAKLNGSINRNSFITAKNINTQDKFINKGNLTITDANNLTFSGEISGDATINSKNITLKNKENDNNLICKISGNLSYSSVEEIEIPEGVVLKEVNYSKYSTSSFKIILSNILDYIFNMIGLLILAHIIYLLIHKFAPKYLDKISNITGLNLLKYLGIGLGFLILIPIISIILLVSNIGTVLGVILLLIYIVLLIIARVVFIIAIATFTKNKIKKDFNIYLYILLIDAILSLITLIPYIGFVISILVSLIGFGMITRSLIPSKK